jgi:calcineurin-like phosphoesterase family protein
MTRYFFTGDTHFGHAKVIKYAHRPFDDADTMDAELIRRWNETVGPKDHVYHLGDFAFCHGTRAAEIASQLHGVKHLVFGNHDRYTKLHKPFLDCWYEARDLMEIKVGDADAPDGKSRKIVLCHYAMRVWNRSHRGAWQLYGHSHGSLRDDPGALQLDVGVDCWDYAPVSYERLKGRMASKTWRAVDHHGATHD